MSKDENRFLHYFLMNAEDVPDYVFCRLPGYFDNDSDLISEEIGDGNLNYIFRVTDKNTKKTIIVKQAAEELRISKEMKISTDRGRIESEILSLQAEMAPGYVPLVYLYDDIMCAICMEDMTGHEMMRTALIRHDIFPKFADQITDFLVNTLLFTSDIVLPHKEKERLSTRFVNPDLCEISYDLVYTEPYNDCHRRNIVSPGILKYVQEELYSDKKLHLEVAKLKYDFLTNAQCLIHGDLHTGSIFINKDHTFVFDPEFAFYGPAGYDIGNIIANLFFAWCHADAVEEDSDKRTAFCDYILATIHDITDMFITKFKKAYRENVSDISFKTDEYMEYYLAGILADTAGVAGLETIRRTVGMAGVKDIRSIEDTAKRECFEKVLIKLGKDYILRRNEFKCGDDYVNTIKNATAAIL